MHYPERIFTIVIGKNENEFEKQKQTDLGDIALDMHLGNHGIYTGQSIVFSGTGNHGNHPCKTTANAFILEVYRDFFYENSSRIICRICVRNGVCRCI